MFASGGGAQLNKTFDGVTTILNQTFGETAPLNQTYDRAAVLNQTFDTVADLNQTFDISPEENLPESEKEKLNLTRTRILTETDDLNNESLAVDCVLADLDCVLTIPDLPSPKFLPALDEDFSPPGQDPNIVSPSYNRILTQQEMDISPFNRSTVGK